VHYVLDWLTNTPYAAWVRESWGWAAALTLHAFGNAMVVGFIFIMGLRLFGFFRTIPLGALNTLFPLIWIGIGCQVVSGGTLWMTKPARYISDGVFDVKFTLVVIGILVTWFYQRFLKRNIPLWQEAGAVSKGGVRFAALAGVIWAGVLIMGRLTAYLGQLYK
jgi:hypothetical protein